MKHLKQAYLYVQRQRFALNHSKKHVLIYYNLLFNVHVAL